MIFALAGLALPVQSAPLYTTYSAWENGNNPGARQGHVYIYSIFPNTDCYLYTTTTSSPLTPTDISTGALYTSLGMANGQPFAPGIIDPGGSGAPGFGDHYFMLKSTYPMIWELGSDITANAQDRDTFIVSDNATFRGQRFFTHLDCQADLGNNAVNPLGDEIIIWNPNTFPVTATLSRWTGVAGNYTPLVSQTIAADSMWETGGTMPWEIAGAQGTDCTHVTHYEITADNDIMVCRGNVFDSDNDNAWTGGPAWDTGFKVGTTLYGYSTTTGPDPSIAVTDASGAANSYQLWHYVPNGLAPAGNYMIGNTNSGTWVLETTRPLAANATDAFVQPYAFGIFKVIANAPVQFQAGELISRSNNEYGNADWFTGISGNNEPLNTDFRFWGNHGTYVSVVAPTVGTAVTLKAGTAQIAGRGSNTTTGPIVAFGATTTDSQTTTVPNQAISWWCNSGTGGSQYRVTSSNPVYTFQGSPGWGSTEEKYYSAPVPETVFSQVNMVKSVNKTQAYPNDTLTYTVHYTNAGNTTLTAVNLWDPIPANTTYVTGSATSIPLAGTTSYDGTKVNWYYPSLAPGATGTLTFQVQVSASAPLGSYVPNTMQAQDDGTWMPQPGNSNTVKTLIVAPLVAVTKANNPPGIVGASTPITYTLSYQNTGSTPATGVYICDTIPAGTVLVAASESSSSPPVNSYSLSGNLLCWNIPNLPAQYSAQVETSTPNTVSTSTGMTSPTSVYACDGTGASVTGNTSGSEVVALSSFAFPAGAAITSVVIDATWWSTKYLHMMGLNFSTDGSNPTNPVNTFGATTAASPGGLASLDITSMRAWTPALVNATKVFFNFTPFNSPNNQETAAMDCLKLVVNYTVPSGAVYSGTLSFQVLPSGCAGFNFNNQARESDLQSSGSLSNLVTNTFSGCTPTATSTNSPSFTFSPTLTRTSTYTATPTFTATPTSSSTPTFTATSSATPTFTATQTFTFTPSATFSPTQSLTFTGTPTYTQTPSITASPTQSDTFTGTPSFTDTATSTATPTQSFTYTGSPTFTDTVTPSATPTTSDTFTGTPSFTDTATFTATPTQSFTFTGSPTFTDTATPSASPTASDTFSPSPTATPSATPSLTSSITLTDTSTQTPTDTPTFTPSDTQTQTYSPSPSSTGTPTASATSTVTLTASPTPTSTGTPTVTGTYTDSPTASPTPTVSPTFTPMAPFRVKLEVFNSSGELVDVLAQGMPVFQQPTGMKALQATFVPDTGGAGTFVLAGTAAILSWNGANSQGQLVASGTYQVLATLADSFGHTTDFYTALTVLRQDRTVKVEIYDSAGELVRHWQEPDQGAAGTSSINLSTTRMSSDGSLTIGWGGGASVVWDGTNDSGQAVQSGQYLVKVTRDTSVGQTEVYSQAVTLLASPHDLLGGATLQPNPALSTDGMVRVLLPAGPAGGIRVEAEVYDLAGERVVRLSNSAQAGEIDWNLDQTGPGVYLIFLKAQDRGGHQQTRVMKEAILR
jgi:uncharacterized repeat protein (TIGR01451 family)